MYLLHISNTVCSRKLGGSKLQNENGQDFSDIQYNLIGIEPRSLLPGIFEKHIVWPPQKKKIRRPLFSGSYIVSNPKDSKIFVCYLYICLLFKHVKWKFLSTKLESFCMWVLWSFNFFKIYLIYLLWCSLYTCSWLDISSWMPCTQNCTIKF